MAEERPAEFPRPEVAPDLSKWVRRMAGFLDRVESQIRTSETVPAPAPELVMAHLRELREEAHHVREELPDLHQLRTWAGKADRPAGPPWVVKIDLELVRQRMSREDGIAHSADDVRDFLTRAGFTSLDGFWSVREAQLGHLEPDEVNFLLNEEGQVEPAVIRAAEDRLDWQENQTPQAQAAATRMMIAIAMTAVVTAALASAAWFWAYHGR